MLMLYFAGIAGRGITGINLHVRGTCMASASDLESDELLALAKHDIGKERYEEALLKLKKILADSPESGAPVDAFAELGRLNLRLGLRDKAEQAFKQCLVLNPEAVQEEGPARRSSCGQRCCVGLRYIPLPCSIPA